MVLLKTSLSVSYWLFSHNRKSDADLTVDKNLWSASLKKEILITEINFKITMPCLSYLQNLIH